MSGHRYYTPRIPKVARPARRRAGAAAVLHANVAHNRELLAHQIRVSGGTTFADPPAFKDTAAATFDAWVAEESLDMVMGDDIGN
jgi:hypothetical protein